MLKTLLIGLGITVALLAVGAGAFWLHEELDGLGGRVGGVLAIVLTLLAALAWAVGHGANRLVDAVPDAMQQGMEQCAQYPNSSGC